MSNTSLLARLEAARRIADEQRRPYADATQLIAWAVPNRAYKRLGKAIDNLLQKTLPERFESLKKLENSLVELKERIDVLKSVYDVSPENHQADSELFEQISDTAGSIHAILDEFDKSATTMFGRAADVNALVKNHIRYKKPVEDKVDFRAAVKVATMFYKDAKKLLPELKQRVREEARQVALRK